MDYATKNNIQVKFQYEENLTENKRSFEKKPYTNDNRDGFQSNTNANTNSNNTGFVKSYNNGDKSNTSSYNKNKFNKTENSNYYNKGTEGVAEPYQENAENSQYQYKNSYNNTDSGYKKAYRPKKAFYKVGDNKFDQCNTHLPQFMGMMQPQYNPYLMQGQGQGKVPQQQYVPQPRYQDSTPNLADDSDKSIVEYLEQYLSLDNLNKDLYLRNRIDANGYIEGNEIVNHNKVSRKGITLERLTDVVKEHHDHPVIEAAMT